MMACFHCVGGDITYPVCCRHPQHPNVILTINTCIYMNNMTNCPAELMYINHLQVFCMLCYHRSQVERQPGCFVGFSLANITSCCLAEHLPLVAKRAAGCHGVTAQLFPSAPPRERALFPSPPSSCSVCLCLVSDYSFKS